MKTRKRFKALAIICFLSVHSLIAQNPSFEWVKQMGGIAPNYGNAITVDQSGNIYSTGKFRNLVDFDPGEGTANLLAVGSWDMFVQKLDANGDFLWAKQMGGVSMTEGSSIATDNLGNVYTTGRFEITVDFDPGVDTVLLHSAGYSDIFVQKLDTHGDFIWVRQMGGSKGDRGTAIAVDDVGNVYTTGWFEGTVDFDPGIEEYILTAGGKFDIFIQKLDANGEFVWAMNFGGDEESGSDVGYSLTVDGDGNVYVTGRFRGTADFDPGVGVFNLTSAGYEDAFILKLNTDGDLLWVKQMGGTSAVSGQSIAVDSAGNVFSSGYFKGTADFDPGAGTVSFTSSGGGNLTDVYIQKLDANGDFQWAHQIGGNGRDSGRSLTLDTAGNVYTTGYFQGTVDFDPGAGEAILTANGEYNSFLQKLDTDGNFIWVNKIDGLGARATHVDGYVNIYTIGDFLSTVDFNPGEEVNTLTATSSSWDPTNYEDIFIRKLSECIPTPPVPNEESLPDLLDQCKVIAPELPTANNGCGRIIRGTTTTLFPITTQGTTPIIWTYDDGNGNTATQTQLAIITDVTAPVSDLSALPVVTAQCVVDSIAPPYATDNCVGTVVGTTATVFPITAQGTTNIVWIYDDGNGNSATQSQEVLIDDITDPVPDVPVLPYITALCEVTAFDVQPPTATDNCVGVISASAILLPITNPSITEISWTFDDGNGNVVTQPQAINWLEMDVSTVTSGLTLTANNDNATYQWVACDTGNTPLDGEINQSFTATENGNYAVQITEEGCVALSECVAITTVGIREVGLDVKLKVYPNPSPGVFNIAFDKPVAHAVLTLTDARGKLVSTFEMNNSAKARVEINEPPGVYMLTIRTAKGQKTVQLVKE